MKKFLFMFLLALLAVSCSKKVEIKGKITNANPLERIEVIEASGVGTLPLINMGLNTKGEFSGSFDAPKDGMYAITYGRNMNMIYLKKGQTLDISGNSADFPQKFVINGDAKANNDFIQEAQKNFDAYASKINIQEYLMKDEAAFLTGFKKIKDDVFKSLDASAKKYNADNAALQFKKDETDARLLGLLDAYEQNYGQLSGKPTYKVSANFANVRKELAADSDRMIREIPAYRDYLLNSMSKDFQTFAQSKNPGPDTLLSSVFAQFLSTKKDLSQTAKDYLFAYVVAQSDINFNNVKKYDAITKLIDTNVQDAKIKTDLKELQTVLMGHKSGTVPELPLVAADGKTLKLSDLKRKPTLVTFYASWNPNIQLTTLPVLKEVTNFYKSKMNFAYVNLDDTKEQFSKTSTAMFKGYPGTNYWVEGGLNADAVKKFGIYSFKTPSFIILDKDGKISGRPFFNLGDPELIAALDAATGLKAPQVQQPTPQMMPGQQMPQQAPTTEPAPVSK